MDCLAHREISTVFFFSLTILTLCKFLELGFAEMPSSHVVSLKCDAQRIKDSIMLECHFLYYLRCFLNVFTLFFVLAWPKCPFGRLQWSQQPVTKTRWQDALCSLRGESVVGVVSDDTNDFSLVHVSSILFVFYHWWHHSQNYFGQHLFWFSSVDSSQQKKIHAAQPNTRWLVDFLQPSS